MRIAVVQLLFVSLSLTHALRCWHCDLSFSNDGCLKQGSLVSCDDNQFSCEDQVRHIMGGRMMLVGKRCKQKQACQTNLNQNLRPASPIQCHVNSPSSICTCCCDRDGCNRDLATCWDSYPTFAPPSDRSCPSFPSAPDHGRMQCEGNKEAGTKCKFSCNSGFYMEGKSRITCLGNGEWDYEVPVCSEKYCPTDTMRSPGNGSMICTRGNYLRSRCRFSCNRNYALVGSEFVDCRESNIRRTSRLGRWSSRQPRCRPLFCNYQEPLYHATFTCDSGNRVGSTCSFSCPPRFEIFPNNIPGIDFSNTRCMPNGHWETPFPCCHLPCPPFAIVDFFLVLDSSSSVQLQNWNRMKQFVLTMLSNFTVRDDAAQFSAFRYNQFVDTDTQIFLNASRNQAEFVRAFNRIPYNGDGTRTGRALDHLRTRVLPVGNRENAKDVVLLITDGISNDRVAIPARRLRGSGVLLLVLPIQHSNQGEINFDQIEQIAGRGNSENILRNALEGGFDALNEEFARELSRFLCPIPCANPFHNHPDEIPHRLEGYIDSHHHLP